MITIWMNRNGRATSGTLAAAGVLQTLYIFQRDVVIPTGRSAKV